MKFLITHGHNLCSTVICYRCPPSTTKYENLIMKCFVFDLDGHWTFRTNNGHSIVRFDDDYKYSIFNLPMIYGTEIISLCT